MQSGKVNSQERKTHEPRRYELVHGKCAAFSAIGLALVAEFFSKYPSEEFVRNIAPEPLDFFNHSANFAYSIVIGAYISLKTSTADRLPEEWSQRRRNSLGAAIGLSTVSLANALTETRFGVNLVGAHSTPDYIDAVYGLAGGLAGVEAARVKGNSMERSE